MIRYNSDVLFGCNIDQIYRQSRCDLDAIQMQFRCNSDTNWCNLMQDAT